ncbi:D-threitol dehydrogenase [Thermatribacter velox]|jgi:NAD(P)-dependent dehydrogenase (short-subunit alcohol dehydrogenase family)|uniref:D-threitol dehydrogenase n=1 Tax=Thermatribacter velox TaxID=3039681 RepID=A0ABZ2Y9W4_9BACT
MSFQFAEFDLTDKTALVTGAAQGIGKAIALLFASKGADLVLVDLKEGVKNLAEEVAKLGKRALPIVADLTDFSSLPGVVEKAMDVFSKIDILVNNAGVAILDDAENLSEEAWDKTMDINLKAPFLLSQLVGREMIKRKSGKIINIASQAGIVALDRHVAYCTSKAGLIAMTKVLALEWGEFGINVNAIAPTVVLTELGKKAWAGEVGEAMKQKIPLRRFALPEEIAAAALFLASNASDMITGTTLVVDGGYTIQ